MSLWQNLLLFLPLALVISLITSALRRDSLAEILRHGVRSFLIMTAAILGGAVVIYFVMEWWLDH
ncbi:MAG: hypothetical protein KDB53_08180 [Planctomycetes bacterium]|nr:hypothetical protein [Planctomycetota bacterium]